MQQPVIMLQRHIEIVEAERNAAQAACQKAEERAAIAEKSERDAWAFAKAALRSGRR